MALAKIVQTIPQFAVLPPPVVVLELSFREAEILHRVVRNVGGHPSGARGAIDGIMCAFENAGVERYEGSVIGKIDLP